MTVDLEPDLRSKKSKSIELALPRLLNFFDDHTIKATFFTVTSLLEKYESEIKDIAKKHEIASHSHTHAWLNEQNAEFEIGHSKKILKDYGLTCEGFRAPKFITTKNHFDLLKRHGYNYDSSFVTVLPSTFKVKEIKGIKSISFPALPSGLTYRKLLHPVSAVFPRPKLFYLHPWEFLEKNELPPATSVTELLLRRNTGNSAWKIYTKFVEEEKKEETERCRWIGCSEFLKENRGL